jgi:hypothetical protein
MMFVMSGYVCDPAIFETLGNSGTGLLRPGLLRVYAAKLLK